MIHAFDNTRWLAIVGIGEGGIEELSTPARRLIGDAEFVFGGDRHLALASALLRGKQRPWPSPLVQAVAEIIALRGHRVAVLASGDPFLFGIGGVLSGAVPASEMICIPAVSSVSLACSRLGWPLQDTAVLSLCGRALNTLVPQLQPCARIIALSADASTPAMVSRLLTAKGCGGSKLILLEALGGPRERIREFYAQDFNASDVDPLNLLAIEIAVDSGRCVLPLSPGLPDGTFAHDGQITKWEMRAVTLSALAPRKGEMLWDIGCGSGSVAIEWILRNPANRAVALDLRQDRAERARRNAAELGATSLDVRVGAAPEALEEFPGPPDAIFIGGGISAGLIERAMSALADGGRLVVNAVTLEAEATLIDAWRSWGGDLSRLSFARAAPLGSRHSFRPAITVTQWKAIKT